MVTRLEQQRLRRTAVVAPPNDEHAVGDREVRRRSDRCAEETELRRVGQGDQVVRRHGVRRTARGEPLPELWRGCPNQGKLPAALLLRLGFCEDVDRCADRRRGDPGQERFDVDTQAVVDGRHEVVPPGGSPPAGGLAAGWPPGVVPTEGAPVIDEKSTCTGARVASSCTSKYSAFSKLNTDAMIDEGKASTRVLSARTLAL